MHWVKELNYCAVYQHARPKTKTTITSKPDQISSHLAQAPCQTVEKIISKPNKNERYEMKTKNRIK